MHKLRRNPFAAFAVFVLFLSLGLSRGGRSTKIHALVEALGNPLKPYLSPGNINDSTVAIEVPSNVTITGSVVLGDKAYGTVAIREHIESNGALTVFRPNQMPSTLGKR